MTDEYKMNRVADDVHLIAAPFRLAWHLVIIFALLLLSPLIFSAVTFGLIFDQHFGMTIRKWLLRLGWFPPIWEVAKQVLRLTPTPTAAELLQFFLATEEWRQPSPLGLIPRTV
jgi:hypothetical protein